jgi:hypothetical protein
VGVRRILNRQYARNAGELGCLGGNGRRVGGTHHNSNVSTGDTARAGHALGGAGIELRAIVLGNDQNFAHDFYTRLPRACGPTFLRVEATRYI